MDAAVPLFWAPQHYSGHFAFDCKSVVERDRHRAPLGHLTSELGQTGSGDCNVRELLLDFRHLRPDDTLVIRLGDLHRLGSQTIGMHFEVY